MGTKWSGIPWRHVTIWCKDSEWDRLNFLSAGSESLSTWLVNTVLGFGRIPIRREKLRGERGRSRPLCVDADKWAVIKTKAAKAGMTVSRYVLACCLDGGKEGR